MADDAGMAECGENISPIKSGDRLILVDGSGYIFRAYHALPPFARPSDGAPVGAVRGFTAMMLRFLADSLASHQSGEVADWPTHIAVIFDPSGGSFRNSFFPQYKANRPPPPEDLVPQFAMIRMATRALGLPAIELVNYEADDLLATYARLGVEAGASVEILSSDKDLMQLVRPGVSLLDPMKNIPLGPEAVMEKFGVTPDKVIDVQALAGDSVDNVPGAPGIGVKTAALLINQFGDLETLLDRAHEIPQPKRREALIEYRAQIEISKRLVTLDDKVAVDVDLGAFKVCPPDPEGLLAFLDENGFHALKRNAHSLLARHDGQIAAIAAASVAEAGGFAEGAGATKAASISTGPNMPSLAPLDRAAYQTIVETSALEVFLRQAAYHGVLAIDTETQSLDSVSGGLVGISLATYGPLAQNGQIDHTIGAYIPLFHRDPIFDAALGGQLAVSDVHDLLAPILADTSIIKIGHNLKYDLSVLGRYGFDIKAYDDTMLLSFVLNAGKHNHGMDDLSERYLAHTPISFKEVCGTGKSQISFEAVALNDATAYAAEDADITLRLWHLFKPQLATDGLVSVYELLERPLVPIISDMELAGVKVDKGALVGLSAHFAAAMERLEKQAHEEAGEVFNLASPKQLGDILFGKMGIAGGKKTKTGAWATDASILEDMAADGQTLCQTIIDYRTVAKLRSTYSEALREAINPKTGRVHTAYNMVGAATGRLSSTDPNLQNIPIRTEEGRAIRHAFVAEEGNLLISADYSQIELRLLAHVGDIPQLQEAFRAGIDIHAMTASEIFGVPLADMDPMVRRRAKAINFGIIYGISAFGLARQLSIPQGEARDYIKAYMARFPGIGAYMEAAKQQGRDKGYVTTIFGRRCHVPALKAQSKAEQAFGERQAINAPLQGAAADIIKRAMIRLPKKLQDAGLKTTMLLQVHDELVFECPAAEAEAAKTLIKSVMEQAAMPLVALKVPLVVEAKAALDWGLAH